MEVSSKISPVDVYKQQIISTADAPKPKGRPPLSVDSEQQRTIQPRMVKADVDQKVAAGIKIFLTSKDIRREFSIDNNTGEITVKIIRNESGRIVMEIPAKTLCGHIGMINETV